jgi:HlyD family secretion protein
MKWIRANLRDKRRLAAALIAVSLIAVTAFLLWGDRAKAAEYTTGKVEKGNLRNTVTATGTLQAVTTVQVGSQASGTISALYADFNSTVRKGQVVAELDPATTKAQVEQSRANLANARAGLAQARASVTQAGAGVDDAQAKALAATSTVHNQRAGVSSAEANLAVLKAQRDDAASLLQQQKSLVESGVISKRDYDTAETGYRTAAARYDQAAAQLNQAVLSEKSSASAGITQSQAQVQQSRAAVEQARAQVQQAEAQVQQSEAALRLAEINEAHTVIRSPIDGVVVSRNVDVGQTVAASLSAPTLFTIANDLTLMQVIANIDQADIGMVEQAKGAVFSVDAFPGMEFKGTIQQVRLNPQNVQNVVTYNVVIDVSNPDQKLKPGMTANLTMTIDERNGVLKVPNAALRYTPQSASGGSNGTRRNRAAGNTGEGTAQGAESQQPQNVNAAGESGAAGERGAQRGGPGERNFAPATAPVLAGQTRVVWVLGSDGQPQRRRIKVGLTDGISTEIVDGNLQEGETVITGQTVSSESRTQAGQTPPGFSGAPRGGGMGGGGRR